MKKCPYCIEEIQDEEIKCKYCGKWLNKKEDPAFSKDISNGKNSTPIGLSPQQSAVNTALIEKMLSASNDKSPIYKRVQKKAGYLDEKDKEITNRRTVATVVFAVFLIVAYIAASMHGLSRESHFLDAVSRMIGIICVPLTVYIIHMIYPKHKGAKYVYYLFATLLIIIYAFGGILYKSEQREKQASAEAPKVEAPIAQPTLASASNLDLLGRAESLCSRKICTDPQKAIEYLTEAIKIKQDLAETYCKRGYAYQKLSNYNQAIQDYNKAIELNPNNELIYYIRGGVHNKFGRYQRAIGDFSEAINLKPDYAKAYAAKGSAYAYLKQYSKAQEIFDKAIKLKPDDTYAYYNYACMFALQKNDKQACNWLQNAIEKGYKDWKHINEDKDFDNIRDSSCFINILKKSGK